MTLAQLAEVMSHAADTGPQTIDPPAHGRRDHADPLPRTIW
jgi:hypothetical protein